MGSEELPKRNLAIMWFANFFVAGSMTMVVPFLSLYIGSLGEYSEGFIRTWSGWTFAITFVTAFIFSPIWGRLGDKKGRKPILIFVSTGLALSLLMMGFVTSVYQLFILRFMMGIFTGFIPMSQALISTQTPKKYSGRVLGTLQTGNVTGSLAGPLLGGVLADNFGFTATFLITSITIFSAGMIVLFGVKEYRIAEDKNDTKQFSSKEVLQFIFNRPMLVSVIVISMLIQIAHFAVQPILALYVEELNGTANIAFFAGLAFSITGLGNLLMTKQWGRIGDRVGHEKILIALLFASAIVYLPGGFVNSVWQLIIIRFLLGVTLGGLMPVRMAYIRNVAPISIQGEVIGYNTSLMFLGNVIGPVLGGIISGFYSISTVFLFTSGLLFINGVILLFIRSRESNSSASKIQTKTKHATR